MSTLKTNNIQHVDRSDPSIIINTDGSVNIAGTMTYEDVTNVDAVGIITGRNNIDAQKQVHVGTGVSIAAGGLNVTAGISTFGGDVSIADKIIHTGDTDTAIRFPSGDTITAETAGTERFRIDSIGRVGIGTDNITSHANTNALQIHDDYNGAGVPRIRLTNISTGTGAADGFELALDGTNQHGIVRQRENADIILYTNNTEKVRIKAGGDVGIGVSIPLASLDVRDASGNDPTMFIGHSNADVEGEFLRIGRIDLPTIRYHSIKAMHGGAVANNYISFNLHNTVSNTAQSEILRIVSNGKVGINTDVPHVTGLTISGDNARLQLTSPTTGGGSGDGVIFGLDGTQDFFINNRESSKDIKFFTEGTERVAIDSGGTVLFKGNANPCASFDRGSANTTNLNIKYNGSVKSQLSAASGAFEISGVGDTPIKFYVDGNERLRLLSNGNMSLLTGDLLIATNGKGIDFSATEGTSNTSNENSLLDDYEEGTWTPAISADSGTVTSYYNQEGAYTKIGRLVKCHFRLRINDAGDTSGNILIKDLPFTVGDSLASTGLDGSGGPTYWTGQGVSIVNMTITPIGNDTKAYVYIATASTATLSNLQRANAFGSGWDIRGEIMYFT